MQGSNNRTVQLLCTAVTHKENQDRGVQGNTNCYIKSLNYHVDLFKVISGTSFNSSWHLLKIYPFLIIPGTSFTYIGYLLKLLAPLAKVGTFYIIFVFVSWWGDFGGGILGYLGVGVHICLLWQCQCKAPNKFFESINFVFTFPPGGSGKKSQPP